jgi:hypothetical protein
MLKKLSKALLEFTLIGEIRVKPPRPISRSSLPLKLADWCFSGV